MTDESGMRWAPCGTFAGSRLPSGLVVARRSSVRLPTRFDDYESSRSHPSRLSPSTGWTQLTFGSAKV
jgi:hypothetical protein